MKSNTSSNKSVTAIFAAGCFWHIQELFDQVPGVLATRVGYTGGRTENPTYQQVCSDTTGHAEAIRIEYDPAKLSYEELLRVFWECHDPTTKDRQGPDVGRQYRSAIFYGSPQQQEQAEKSKKAIAAKHKNPIVTEILQEAPFYDAEEYHQQYIQKVNRAR